MIRISILCLFLLLSWQSIAQKVTPQVTNIAGFDAQIGNLVISSSIGESAIATFINTDFILTQGFLQPEIIPCGEFALSYYPNPTKDDLILEVSGCDIKIESMQLIDIWGRLITTIVPEKNNKVFLGDISPGVYFIRIFLSNTESQTIKIAKVSN